MVCDERVRCRCAGRRLEAPSMSFGWVGCRASRIGTAVGVGVRIERDLAGRPFDRKLSAYSAAAWEDFSSRLLRLPQPRKTFHETGAVPAEVRRAVLRYSRTRDRPVVATAFGSVRSMSGVFWPTPPPRRPRCHASERHALGKYSLDRAVRLLTSFVRPYRESPDTTSFGSVVRDTEIVPPTGASTRQTAAGPGEG